MRASYERAGVHADLVPFIEDMARRYAEADLLICRAGASTIAELSAAGVPAVLVPFPYAVDDHQTHNARFLSERGGAVLIPQSELTPEKLAGLLGELDRAKLLAMARAARAAGKPEATRRRGSVHEAGGMKHKDQAPPFGEGVSERRAVKHKVKHVHFVGIGGIGMSGIAEVLLNLGYQVSGSDLSESAVTRHLQSLGARIYKGHAGEQIAGANAVVISSAVSEENPEVQAARAKKIPVVPRALMLAELMRLKQGIAVAGTHGKTTTTSLTASVLAEGGLDPTFVIGGRLEAVGSNARLGTGDFIVVEADESDASFLYLQPCLAVVTNIDADHMQTYDHSLDKLRQAFVNFLQHLPFYGVAVLCIDDPGVREIAHGAYRRRSSLTVSARMRRCARSISRRAAGA